MHKQRTGHQTRIHLCVGIRSPGLFNRPDPIRHPQTHIVKVDEPPKTRRGNIQHARIFPEIPRPPEEREHELHAGVIHKPEVHANTFLRHPLHAAQHVPQRQQRAAREDDVVRLREAQCERGCRYRDVLEQAYITLYELVLGGGGPRERRKDGLRGSAVPADDDDVRVALEVSRECLRGRLSDAGCATYEDRDGGRRR